MNGVLSFVVFFHVVSAVWVSAQLPACDITGNWTSTLVPNTSAQDIVHIEITQDAQGAIQVRATPWGASVGDGSVAGYTVSLLMVGADAPYEGNLTVSPYPNFETHAIAPSCSFISGESFNWCKFPYCPDAEPQWPPFPQQTVCALSGWDC